VVKLPTPDFEWINRLVHDAGIYIYAFFALHFWGSIIILALICLVPHTKLEHCSHIKK